VNGVLASTGPSAYWYLTRGTGVVALLLLTATTVLGVASSTRWSSRRLPRFVVAGLHRNLTLLAISFVAVHVLTTLADGFAPIGLRDAILPFLSPYRPFWLGLGAVAFDLLLAIAITSLLRARLGLRLWRGVHWLAYASWPIALLHSLGTGSDARSGWLVLLALASIAVVALAAGWRVLNAYDARPPLRVAAAVAIVVVPISLVAWYRSGPLQRGWASHAGTPSRLLQHTVPPPSTRRVDASKRGTP
jgi:methionine sulfoxide reductase heme-binding subunit